jgi:uncharacterized protein
VSNGHPLSIPLMPPSLRPTGCAEPVSATLPTAIERIVEAVQPMKIILFGSYAHGAPGPDSDVDLLIVLETTASRVERFDRVSRALWPRQFPVDLLVMTPAEVAVALSEGDPLVVDILKRGQVVYERHG